MNQKFIPLSVPNLKGNELKYVSYAIQTEWVSTAGPYVEQMEKEMTDYVKSAGAVSCQNGTSGLHISLIVAGVTNQDAVIVPTLTFIAAVNPVKYVGAEPIFMDCDESLCLDPLKLEKYCETECEFINESLIDKATHRVIKAIIVVHVFGNMADMEKIKSVCGKYNIKIIEDATEALGTYYTQGIYKGKFAGTIGDFGVYSFNGNKIITTGGGGMIVSNDKENLAKAKHLTTQAKSDDLNFIHDEVGYNYRMTNLQAALGIAQLEQLERFIEIKERNYRLYEEKISKIDGLKLVRFRKGIRSNFWFYSLDVQDYKLKKEDLILSLQKSRIQTRPIWGLINEQKPYKYSRSFEIEKAKEFWRNIVNIPCSTNLSENDVETVVSTIKNL